jgi:UDP-glucose 6-dehydrogenase
LRFLQEGVMPSQEPGLAELLDLSANRMVLTDFSDGVVDADVALIAVGTSKFGPVGGLGQIDAYRLDSG